MGLDNYPDGYNAGDYEEYIAQDSQDNREDYYDKYVRAVLKELPFAERQDIIDTFQKYEEKYCMMADDLLDTVIKELKEIDDDDFFICKRSGKTEHMDRGFLVPNVGMISEDHMTDADLNAWHKENARHNPDSYEKDLEDAHNLGYACMYGEEPHRWEAAHHLKQGGFQCVACGEWRRTIDEEE
mgnify:CR=1 FL=1